MFNSLDAVREPLKRHSHGCHEGLKYYEVSYCIRGGKDIWCAFKTDMSLCKITGSYGPYHCKARAKDKFQKALFTYHPKNPSMYQRLLEHLRL